VALLKVALTAAKVWRLKQAGYPITYLFSKPTSLNLVEIRADYSLKIQQHKKLRGKVVIYLYQFSDVGFQQKWSLEHLPSHKFSGYLLKANVN
jgi:hypothetical protein